MKKVFDLEKFADSEAHEVCAHLGTTSNTKFEAAKKIFIDAGENANYFLTQDAAIVAAKNTPVASYEFE